MFLLKKVFQFRDHASEGEDEKPFLDHLEDLRIMLTRVFLTVIIATIFCFAFQDWVMGVLRHPVEQVALNKVSEMLPERIDKKENIDAGKWMESRKIAIAGHGLEASQKEAFLQAIADEEIRFYVQCVWIAEAAAVLPSEGRKGFLEQVADVPDDVRRQSLALLEKDPDLKFDSVSDLRLMSALQPTEAFMLSLKISFFAGLVISFPLLLYFILQFVLPGLKDSEKKAFFPALLIGFGLFLCGVLFAYFFVLPKVLVFFFDYASKLGISNDWRIGYYISFAIQFTLLFGLSFELPVVVMTLVKLGILNYPMMAKTRSYAILAIVFAAAVLTPTPDVGTLSFMAIPMLILYEGCIWMAYFHHKKAIKREEEEEAEYQAYLARRAEKERLRAENGDDGDDDDDEPEPPRRPRPVNPRSPSTGVVPMDPDATFEPGEIPTDEDFGFHTDPNHHDEPDYEAMDHSEEADDEEDDWDPHADGAWDHPPEDAYRDPVEFEISEEEAAEMRGDAELHPDDLQGDQEPDHVDGADNEDPDQSDESEQERPPKG